MKSKDTCIYSSPHGIITETRKPQRKSVNMKAGNKLKNNPGVVPVV